MTLRAPAMAGRQPRCVSLIWFQRNQTPWRDGTTHLVMSPLEFMQRPDAVVVGTSSRSREARASDCFAAASLGRRMPG